MLLMPGVFPGLYMGSTGVVGIQKIQSDINIEHNHFIHLMILIVDRPTASINMH